MRILIVALAAIALGISAQAGASGPAPSSVSADQAAKAVDPVCGMQVDPAKAAGKSDYKGKTYYFCSDHCKRTFDANPEAVLNKKKK